MTIGADKKLMKENAILDAAYDLFSKVGVNGTTIDEIVHKAGVAKGTFYLYFHDKYDLLDMIVIRKASLLMMQAIEDAKTVHFENRVDGVICFINSLIDALAQNRLLTRIIHKDLSYSLYKKVLNDPVRGTRFKQIVEDFEAHVRCSGFEEEEVGHLLFILVEMTGSVCYSAIVNNEPATIEEMKPVLFKTIRKILA